MRYYTAQQTIELLNKELPHNPLPYDLAQLADLCRHETITPVFYYSKCLDRIDPENIAATQHQTIEPCTFSGYLTADSLISLIHAPATTAHSISIDYAAVYEVIKAGYKWLVDSTFSRLFIKGDLVVLCGHEQAHDDRYPMSTHDLKEHDAASVTLNDLLFPSEQVQVFIDDMKAEHASDTDELSDQSAKGHQTTIGVLLELLLEPQRGRDKELFSSQSELATYIDKLGIRTQSAKTINDRFALANAALETARKSRPRAPE
uniref:hypothetical protein n=1 Tax=Psychrobacter sp. TaxID=56811 RepID=UPI0015987390|nr:hypothetical protein [Psychrobacter sp.]QJS05281.1 hypothetical protein [Psychrobacter sp.]